MNSAGHRAQLVTDFTQHRRLAKHYDEARPASWKAPDGLVHITEAMSNPFWGVDRITLCRSHKLNPGPQQSHRTLELHPSKEAVTCLLCLAL